MNSYRNVDADIQKAATIEEQEAAKKVAELMAAANEKWKDETLMTRLLACKAGDPETRMRFVLPIAFEEIFGGSQSYGHVYFPTALWENHAREHGATDVPTVLKLRNFPVKGETASEYAQYMKNQEILETGVVKVYWDGYYTDKRGEVKPCALQWDVSELVTEQLASKLQAKAERRVSKTW